MVRPSAILPRMRTSLQWLQRYLTPADLTVDEADHVLTHVGFPIEEQVELPTGDMQLDVELTSNRGDCLCHVGLAREIAASTGRTLAVPTPKISESGPDVSSLTSVDNRVPDVCPLFTARVIRGVRVGPSPAWLVEALEAIGQRSINNVVDISNFVLFELGHPNHTFDLDRLKGGIHVRAATGGETLMCLDDIEHKLHTDDVVVADDSGPVSLAGVIGGRPTGVTEETTNVLIEVATWDPTRVRNTARRHQITTDAGHRFERYVDARDVETASRRVAELIMEVAGGELCSGVIMAGSADAPRTVVDFRLSRCEHLLGIEVPREELVRLLTTVEIAVEETGDPDVLRCTIPHHRHDVTREVDLIEEVIRLHGIEHIEVAPRMEVIVRPPQSDERACRMIGDVLTGQGFYETVTVSFLTEQQARPFIAPGGRLLKVDEDRRKENPWLRPAIIPSLLTCRKANQDGRVHPPEGVRLFETASVFGEVDDGETFGRQTLEFRNLALLADLPRGMKAAEAGQAGVRTILGAVESVARSLGGPQVKVDVVRHDQPVWSAYDGKAWAALHLNGAMLGTFGLIARPTLDQWGLEEGVVCAEVNLDALVALFPPVSSAHPLPSFPGIERDLSIILDEATPWSDVEAVIEAARLDLMVGHEFVTTYRGKQIGAGRKSVTLRLHFRDPERTLRHEEVDPQMETLMGLCREKLSAEIRG